jgi:prepilin-type N-terminal cleavage/methylation domain-containing protein
MIKVQCSNKKQSGFTMVELMLAMVILSIGIVALLRSFLSVVNALAVTGEKIEASSMLDSKVSGVQEQAMIGGGLSSRLNREDVLLANHKAVYEERIFSFPRADLKKTNLTEAVFTVSWNSGSGNHNQTITTAFLEANKTGS